MQSVCWLFYYRLSNCISVCLPVSISRLFKLADLKKSIALSFVSMHHFNKPGKPQMMSRKWNFQGITLFSLYSSQTINGEYSIKQPHWSRSKKQPIYVWKTDKKICNWKMPFIERSKIICFRNKQCCPN